MMNKEQVKHLYLHCNHTQKGLAKQAGVSEKTLYLWIRDGKWKEEKTALLTMPARVIECIYRQMMAINAAIMQRPADEQFGSPKEIASLNRLAATIGLVKKHAPSINSFPTHEVDWQEYMYDQETPPVAMEEEILPVKKAEEITGTENTMNAETIENEPIACEIPLPEALPEPEKSGNAAATYQPKNIPAPVAAEDDTVAEKYELAKYLAEFKTRMWTKQWPTYYEYVQDEKLANMIIKENIKEGMLPKSFDVYTIFPLKYPIDF